MQAEILAGPSRPACLFETACQQSSSDFSKATEQLVQFCKLQQHLGFCEDNQMCTRESNRNKQMLLFYQGCFHMYIGIGQLISLTLKKNYTTYTTQNIHAFIKPKENNNMGDSVQRKLIFEFWSRSRGCWCMWEASLSVHHFIMLTKIFHHFTKRLGVLL